MENRRKKIGIIKAIKRLWLFATCNHWGCSVVAWCFEDTTKIVICRKCGRILSFTTSGERKHNPHWDFDQTGDHLDWLALGRRRRLDKKEVFNKHCSTT